MAEIFKKRIIGLLQHDDYQPVKLKQLAKSLGVDSEHYTEFKEAFDSLRTAGHVVIGAKNLVTLPALTGRLVGTFRANPKGFGFIIPREPNAQGDLFIPPNATADAMNGDIVLANVKRQGKRLGQMRYTGEIVRILERAQNKLVGTLVKHADGWLVMPDGKGSIDPISVDDITAKNAKTNDKVVVEILNYAKGGYLARGVILEVLGKAGRYETEIRSVVHQYHLPGEFATECVNQARQAASGFNPDKAENREDITNKVIATIDPPDAKDFDDAISIEADSKGNWILGVHIADVSTFVTADSPLDIEAKERGNSVYLPGRTIPMLPEILSNGICSLQPDQKRFTKSAYITYDSNGNILARRFANSIIRSTQRLTYIQADKALKERTKGIKPEIVALLKDMQHLAQLIEQRRTKNGMLHLDLPETELVMDKAGRVVDAHPADDSYPHTIIEMFMVEANDAVASLLDRLNVQFIRRIHPEPDILSFKNLAMMLKAFGLSLPRNVTRAALQELLAGVKGHDFSFAVNLAVLRSFEKAEYAPLNIGHYALASKHYCHFTSPIRRYADLTVHRILDTYLRKGADSLSHSTAGLDLVEIGKHITFTEQKADDAEKELKTVLILQMLSKRIGEQMQCVTTGLTNFGIFVQCKKFGIDGLIKMEDLGPDQWKFDKKTQCIIGLRSGCAIRLGQSLTAQIVSVNVPARQLNLAPAEPIIKPGKKRKPQKDTKTKSRKTQRRNKRRR
ncbi:MAG: ribonuclease R [Sedimentisphaerales bacterium]|nr:ribonuclease R [Sedimentisphaerales bacterium]